jgi:hypothetical protein
MSVAEEHAALILKMELTSNPKMEAMATTYHTTQCHNAENHNV